MALPTTNLTLHCDASDTDKIFTTYNISGTHTGVPADGNGVQVWDDEGDGIADVALIYNSAGSTDPNYRSSTPLMQLPCLDFDGTNDYLLSWNQTGTVLKTASDFIANSAFTIVLALYPESITLADASPFNNHCVLGDVGRYFGLYLKDVSGSAKALVYNFDGNSDVVTLDITTSNTYVIMMRHEGGNLYGSVNGGSESSVASGNTSVVSTNLQVGRSTISTNFNGRIGELAIWNAALSGSNLSDAISYFTNKWLAAAPVGHPAMRRLIRPIGMDGVSFGRSLGSESTVVI